MTGPLKRGSAIALAALLAGCGGIKLWPFGDSGPAERSLTPANATEYRCDGGRRFFVRPLDANAVWLIAPDREIRLPKIGATTYGIAKVVLDIAGDSAALTDPPASFTGCKRATAPQP